MHLSPAENDRQGDINIISPIANKSNKNTDWKPFKRVPNAQAIADGLKIIPSDWSLTPTQDKSPKRANWQIEEFIPHQEIAKLILHGERRTSQKGHEYTHFWSGFGIRTGEASGGKVAIDVDGSSAQPILEAIAGGDLPTTVDWTSGKAGRHQILFRVPDEIRPLLKDFNRAVLTEWGELKTATDDEGKPLELLEFRYNHVQSVLPPSRHPSTGSYQWINSPDTTEVAIAPKWLCDLLVNLANSERTKEQEYKQRAIEWAEVQKQAKYQSNTVTTLVDFLNFDILPRLSVDQIFNWDGHNFRQYGKTLKGNPPWRSSVSGTSFHCWFDGSQWAWQDKATGEGGGAVQYRWKLRGGLGKPRGKDFVEVVKELAFEAGVEMPEFAPDKEWDDVSSSKQSTPSNIVPHPALTQQANINVVKNEIEELLSRDLSASEIETAKIDLRRRHPSVLSPEMDKLWNAIASDLQKNDARIDDREELDKLLKLGEQSLILADYLPRTLADPLSLYCEWLNVKPETVLLALLTATSSLHQVGTELVIHRTQGFFVPPTIMAAMVSESGQKKSPITRQIVSKPLALLKKEALENYAADYENYQLELEEWEQRKTDTPKGTKFTEPMPEEPTPAPIFYFTEANGEGIKAQAQKAPTKALFALVDELVGFFNSADKYRNGKGSDKQDLLSYYDGTGQTVLRSSGVKVDVSQIYLSIFGTIQPEVIRSVMRGSEDPDGQWARFLYVQQPLAASVLRDDDGSAVDIVDLLAGVYRRLHNTPSRQYTLSREAFKVYQPYYNRLEQMRVTHPNPGMRAVYSKAEGYTGRLALNLHVLHELSTGTSTPSTEIPVERMRQAIALMNFFIGQTRLLYSAFDEGTAPHIIKMMELSQRLRLTGQEGWIKAKDIQSGYNSKSRPKPDVVRGWMQEAVNLGLGEIRGIPTRLEFRSLGESKIQKVDSVDSSGQKVDLKWTRVEMAETPTRYMSGDSNNIKVDLVDSPPPSQDATILTDMILATPQEKVDFSGIGESTSPLKTQSEDGEPVSAVDSESTFPSTDESTFSPALLPTPETINVGTRVKIVFPGSKRDGKIGTVRKLTPKWSGMSAEVLLDEDPSLTFEQRKLQVAIPGTESWHLVVV